MSALKTEFGGDRADLFQLAIKTGFLTVLTFGIYRFWQMTRFRRWYWSSVRPGGTPMEYTGTALEKLTGFLFAIILLAVYLAIFNIMAIFAAIRLTEGAPDYLTFAFAVTPLALIPIIFVARYRARRYILSRSRWRGIRFGMSRGGWGYAWRACLYWLLTIVTLGLAWPLMTFQLERYLTNRTWFGNARFTQFGSFTSLIGAVVPFLVTLWGSVALAGYLIVSTGVLPGSPETISPDHLVWVYLGFYPALALAALFAVYYRVAAFRIMASMKTLGDGLEFDIHPRTRTLVRIYILGNLLTSFATMLVSGIVLGLPLGVGMAIGAFSLDALGKATVNLMVILFSVAALTIFVFYGVFRQIFITYPMARHVAETLKIHEPGLLEGIRQRDRDNPHDAGGFAEALDVGAAF